MKRQILIFSSRTGGGHISLAEALRDMLAPSYSVEVIEPLPEVVNSNYRWMSRHALWFWSLVFYFSNRPDFTQNAHKIVSSIMEQRLAEVLQRKKPDLVISTYQFLTTEIVSTMQKINQPTPFMMLQSDPDEIHSCWLNEHNADAVLCPTTETYHQTLDAGFSPQQVLLSGWPVRRQFMDASKVEMHQLRRNMGLRPDLFTIFLQGGGEGSASFARSVERILAAGNVQVILALGTNKTLEKKIKRSPRLFLLHYTREIAPYMAAADVVMGKAGPNILFESVSLGKPFIATSYIPGQEKPNLEFIQRHGLGWVALDTRSQVLLIRLISSRPLPIRRMQDSIQAYRSWNSGRVAEILPLVENLINR